MCMLTAARSTLRSPIANDGDAVDGTALLRESYDELRAK